MINEIKLDIKTRKTFEKIFIFTVILYVCVSKCIKNKTELKLEGFG